jgi:Raf kinase inhibitor-like YbhB/YbcL family protein
MDFRSATWTLARVAWLSALLLPSACSARHAAAGPEPTSPAAAAGTGAGDGGTAAMQAGAAAAGSAATTASAGAAALGGGGAAGTHPGAAGANSGAAQNQAGRNGSAGAAGAATGGNGGASGAGAAGTGSSGAGGSVAFALMPVGTTLLSTDEFAFPASALPPSNQSPEFTWSGVPSTAKSLALVFRDLTANAVKWVIWDIPPSLTHLPSGISSQASPSEVPGSSQLGSLGNQGYAGPCCGMNMYEFVLFALDVDKLPGTAGLSTAQIRDNLLPNHDVATTKPIMMRIMP